jgi:hypothetical protein
VDLNVGVTNVLSKVTLSVPLSKLIKITSQKEKVKKFLSCEEANEDSLLILQAMHWGRKNGSHSLVYITLIVNNLVLHNCIMDLGASTNVMSLNVMNWLGLKTTRPYRNVCAMDSREAKVCGLIKSTL